MQMPTDMPHIFAISDIGVQVVLAKKAVHEAHVAVDVIPAAKDRPLHATHFPICVQFRRAPQQTPRRSLPREFVPASWRRRHGGQPINSAYDLLKTIHLHP